MADSSSMNTAALPECLDRLLGRKSEMRPVSTYRLQFNPGFRFVDAAAIVPYLHSIGISHVYASPILKSRSGSAHGYDIIDHNAIDPELGTPEEFDALVEQLHRHGMAIILDIVPNHMGVGYGTNPWWMDLLENGRAAEHARFFDVDWNPLKPELRNKILLPILGSQYGEELETGRLRVIWLDDAFFVSYFDRVLSLDPQTIPMVLLPVLQSNGRGNHARASDHALADLEHLLAEFAALPSHTNANEAQVALRLSESPQLKARLAALVHSSAEVEQLIQRALQRINGTPGLPESFDALHELLEAQVYRLAHWRVSGEEINYRRFFDINDLVGLRMEDEQVFAATHPLLRRMLAEGKIQGLRIDHLDGLLNPRQYLIRLQMLYAASQCVGAQPVPPLAENGIERPVQNIFGQHDWMGKHGPLYVLVEKILEPGEELPQEWAIEGTSGYDFTNLVNGIFIQRRNERAFTNLYSRFTGVSSDVDTLIYQSKKIIMDVGLASEVNVLAHILDEISSYDRRARDYTRKALRDAIRETIACFPVYRTYIDERGEATERDRRHIHEAIARAKRRNTGMSAGIFDFLREILIPVPAEKETRYPLYRLKLHFTLKFQQLTGPVMAKGLEDTACYVYNRFISENEVGGTPRRFGLRIKDFHAANLERARHWPYAMLATSTHDTKHSEDVRARINVLSEMPRGWSAFLNRARRLNRTKKRIIGDRGPAPDANEEYLLYQTLLGAWPFHMQTEDEHRDFNARIQQYMEKALHEAKVNLSWINPYPEYVDAIKDFTARILAPPSPFLEHLKELLGPIMYFGAINSLAQLLVKLTAPGVPDQYQGTELWDFSLVDPDNRRKVDYCLRKRFHQELATDAHSQEHASLCRSLLNGYQDGRVKLWTTMRALCFRKEHAELFGAGSYTPLFAAQPRFDHLCAFARQLSTGRHSREMSITAVPRFAYTYMQGQIAAPMGDAWRDVQLEVPAHAPQEFRNVLSGETLRLNSARNLWCREVFANFPVALLAA
jgi:(1->4)-alpha-D-glucan 1-alpha-D-glucosylmutase